MLIDFGGLFERYSQDVFRFALYLSGNQALAEDICQETFVRAWVTPDKIRGGTVKAYLFVIARNLYRDELGRRARQVDLEHDAVDPKPGPDAITGGRLELDDVLRALQALTEIDRAVLLMSAQDGLSHAEIAAALDLSVATVKVRIHRARIRLQRVHAREGVRE